MLYLGNSNSVKVAKSILAFQNELSVSEDNIQQLSEVLRETVKLFKFEFTNNHQSEVKDILHTIRHTDYSAEQIHELFEINPRVMSWVTKISKLYKNYPIIYNTLLRWHECFELEPKELRKKLLEDCHNYTSLALWNENAHIYDFDRENFSIEEAQRCAVEYMVTKDGEFKLDQIFSISEEFENLLKLCELDNNCFTKPWYESWKDRKRKSARIPTNYSNQDLKLYFSNEEARVPLHYEVNINQFFGNMFTFEMPDKITESIRKICHHYGYDYDSYNYIKLEDVFYGSCLSYVVQRSAGTRNTFSAKTPIQLPLCMIHSTLDDVYMKHFNNNNTYDQNVGIVKMLRLQKELKYDMLCYDISKYSDTLSIDIMSKIVRLLFGSDWDYIESYFKDLMMIPIYYVNERGDRIVIGPAKHGTLQGLFSDFPCITAVNIFTAYFLYYILSKYFNLDVTIEIGYCSGHVGDDLFIGVPKGFGKIAGEVLEYIWAFFNCKINSAKKLEVIDGEGYSTFVNASFKNGEPTSGLPPRVICKGLENISDIRDVIHNLVKSQYISNYEDSKLLINHDFLVELISEFDRGQDEKLISVSTDLHFKYTRIDLLEAIFELPIEFGGLKENCDLFDLRNKILLLRRLNLLSVLGSNSQLRSTKAERSSLENKIALYLDINGISSELEFLIMLFEKEFGSIETSSIFPVLKRNFLEGILTGSIELTEENIKYYIKLDDSAFSSNTIDIINSYLSLTHSEFLVKYSVIELRRALRSMNSVILKDSSKRKISQDLQLIQFAYYRESNLSTIINEINRFLIPISARFSVANQNVELLELRKYELPDGGVDYFSLKQDIEAQEKNRLRSSIISCNNVFWYEAYSHEYYTYEACLNGVDYKFRFDKAYKNKNAVIPGFSEIVLDNFQWYCFLNDILQKRDTYDSSIKYGQRAVEILEKVFSS